MEEVTNKIKCLYYIKDLRTDKIIYIGQTKDFNQRKNNHFRLNKNPIDKYMFENGRYNFSMEIFTNIDYSNITNEELRKTEDELIINYDTINTGFNRYRSGLITKNWNYYNEYMKQYHKTEKYKEYNKEYHKTEKYKEYQKKYYQEHK